MAGQLTRATWVQSPLGQHWVAHVVKEMSLKGLVPLNVCWATLITSITSYPKCSTLRKLLLLIDCSENFILSGADIVVTVKTDVWADVWACMALFVWWQLEVNQSKQWDIMTAKMVLQENLDTQYITSRAVCRTLYMCTYALQHQWSETLKFSLANLVSSPNLIPCHDHESYKCRPPDRTINPASCFITLPKCNLNFPITIW